MLCLTLSQALLMSKHSTKLSKGANLFEVSTWDLYVIEIFQIKSF
jgi:hypothetical protein